MVAQVVGLRLAAEPVPAAMEQAKGAFYSGVGGVVAEALQNALEGGYRAEMQAQSDHELAWDMIERVSDLETFAAKADEVEGGINDFHAMVVKIIKFKLIRD